MSTFDDAVFHRSPTAALPIERVGLGLGRALFAVGRRLVYRASPAIRPNSRTGWVERLLQSGAEPFDPPAAEAMIAAARAAFGQIEIRRSGTKLRYIAKGNDPETLGD